MDYSWIVTFLSIAVSGLMFCITYMYAQPLKTMMESIKECVQEIKTAIIAIREENQALRADVNRLQDHEKALWRAIDELKMEIRRGGETNG